MTMADKKGVFAYRRDKQTNKFQGWIPETIADVGQFIGNLAPKVNVPDTWYQLVVADKKTQIIMGDIGLHFIGSENKQVEIGFTFSKQFQGQGFATKSVSRVINYLFNDLHKHRIVASIDPKNAGAIRLVERIGFRKEAHFIKSLWINGQWVDDLVYALIEKDWEDGC